MAFPQKPWSLDVTMPDGQTYDARRVAEHVAEQVHEYAHSAPLNNQDRWIAYLRNAASIVLSAAALPDGHELSRKDVVNTFLDGLIEAAEMLKEANSRDASR
jgi:hypothetical protein